MRNLKDIDINKSLEQKKLIYPEKWFEKFDSLCVYFFFCIVFIMPFLVYFDPYRNKIKTGSEYYLLFIVSLISIYGIYRKATEKCLSKIITQNEKAKNKKLVKEYCEKLGYVMSQNSKSTKDLYIFDASGFISMRPTDKTCRIFIFDKQTIYFTTIRDNFAGNPPVLTTHIILKYDLKKLVLDSHGKS
ncbi:hypothetical protein [Flavobacterium sp. N1994]|uniref:hypothetical protein n=1 Tax=Flavobacterium sp. N1994 TaxID=2986827 RepID=UPI0022212ECA|nr:hypothetical protein [Flavobacterium sp. N1994]